MTRPGRSSVPDIILMIAVAIIVAAVLLLGVRSQVRALDEECYPIPVTEHTPTGIAGCALYGIGIASHWSGPGVARNDCLYPWTDCEVIHVTSLDTGLTITVQPTMFCDCYVTTPDERIVDLDPASLQALGLDPAQGLYRVAVDAELPDTPLTPLPDTAAARRVDMWWLALVIPAGLLVGMWLGSRLYRDDR